MGRRVTACLVLPYAVALLAMALAG